MALEDFFTLSEMKDGLSAASRVEELVSVMQKEKDAVVNTRDAIRHWTAVATIIAKTENKDCLDLFVQLGGVQFLDRWVRDAGKCASNNYDNFAEESITALLIALEKLCIDKKSSISASTVIALRCLLDHENIKVQDRTRALIDNYIQGCDDAVHQQEEISVPVNDGASVSGEVRRETAEAECNSTCNSSHGDKEDPESHTAEAMMVDNLPLQSSDATEPERVEDAQMMHEQNGSSSPGRELEQTSDYVKDVHMCPVNETNIVEACVPDVQHCSSLGKVDAVAVNTFPVDTKPEDKLKREEENQTHVGATNALEQANVSSDAGCLTSEEIAAGSSVGSKADVDAGNLGAAAIPDLQRSNSEPQIDMAEVPKAVEDNNIGADAAMDSPNHKPDSEKLDDLNNPLLSKEAGAAAKCKDPMKDRYKQVSNLSALYGGRKRDKRSKKARGKKSSAKSEYGMLDALDIARQVAKEVEREVTDYKEPNCSTSSERSSGVRIGQPRSPDSINDSLRSPVDTSSDELSTGQSGSAEGDGRSSSRSGNGDSETNDPMEDVVESSLLNETKAKDAKGFCLFDLNEEVCPDDGSNRAPLNEELHDNTLQKHKGLEIDLNMTEDGEETSVIPATENHIPLSSSVNSKGSSQEANQVRSERLNLDLNSAGDDDDDVVISDGHQFNGRVCPSPASSSSQVQPHERNFDLNDQPFSSLDDPFSDRALYHNPPSRGAIRFGKPPLDPFISIMGAKVEINKDDAPQRSSYLNNGKAALDPSSGGTLGLGPAVSPLYSPLSRCNPLPAGQTISFSLAPYGLNERAYPAVDPRFGPMLPGAAGPTSAYYSPYPVPFPMSLNAGPSRPQLDLNSGFSVDAANRDPGLVMQLFPPSQVKSTGEHPGPFLQPFSGSMVGAKRKEPEGGWEPYPVGYGQHQFPWK